MLARAFDPLVQFAPMLARAFDPLVQFAPMLAHVFDPLVRLASVLVQGNLRVGERDKCFIKPVLIGGHRIEHLVYVGDVLLSGPHSRFQIRHTFLPPF
jgi:hypothetical protein